MPWISPKSWVDTNNFTKPVAITDTLTVYDNDNGTGNPRTITLIDIHEESVTGWFLDIAHHLPNLPENYYREDDQQTKVKLPFKPWGVDFVLLMVVSAFFEEDATFYRGESSDNKSREFFVQGFHRVFSIFPDSIYQSFDNGSTYSLVSNDRDIWLCKAANFTYSAIRCGLFHTGMIKSKVELNRSNLITNPPFSPAIAIKCNQNEVEYIRINVPKMLDCVRVYFGHYINDLRKTSQQNPNDPICLNFMKAREINSQFSVKPLPKCP